PFADRPDKLLSPSRSRFATRPARALSPALAFVSTSQTSSRRARNTREGFSSTTACFDVHPGRRNCAIEIRPGRFHSRPRSRPSRTRARTPLDIPPVRPHARAAFQIAHSSRNSPDCRQCANDRALGQLNLERIVLVTFSGGEFRFGGRLECLFVGSSPD